MASGTNPWVHGWPRTRMLNLMLKQASQGVEPGLAEQSAAGLAETEQVAAGGWTKGCRVGWGPGGANRAMFAWVGAGRPGAARKRTCTRGRGKLREAAGSRGKPREAAGAAGWQGTAWEGAVCRQARGAGGGLGAQRKGAGRHGMEDAGRRGASWGARDGAGNHGPKDLSQMPKPTLPSCVASLGLQRNRTTPCRLTRLSLPL